MNGSNRRGGGEGGGLGGVRVFGPPLQTFTQPLLQNFKYIVRILSSNPVDWHPFWVNWVKGGSVDKPTSQRHTRSGAGRGVSQANGAATHPKLTELCQHEIVEF